MATLGDGKFFSSIVMLQDHHPLRCLSLNEMLGWVWLYSTGDELSPPLLCHKNLPYPAGKKYLFCCRGRIKQPGCELPTKGATEQGPASDLQDVRLAFSKKPRISGIHLLAMNSSDDLNELGNRFYPVWRLRMRIWRADTLIAAGDPKQGTSISHALTSNSWKLWDNKSVLL